MSRDDKIEFPKEMFSSEFIKTFHEGREVSLSLRSGEFLILG
jgi:hypothetical protein